MFTGIIETLGLIKEVKEEGTNKHFLISSPISHEMKTDQSVSHNGVCLTVTAVGQDSHWVTAVQETLSKSNLGQLVAGNKVNLERSMVANGRFDGHIVQGHVDQTGIVKAVVDRKGSWLFDFSYRPAERNLIVEMGSIAINGVSLTSFSSKEGAFSVSIIPYTFEHTNFYDLKIGDMVNLEFDIIGKYVKKLFDQKAG